MKEKAKSKKLHENIIGKIIYGFLLFAPLLMILTTSCYAIFNKNAFESYYGSTINEQQYIDVAHITEFKQNTRYFFDSSSFNNHGENTKGAYARTIVYSNPKVISNNTTLNNITDSSMIGLYITANGDLSVRVFTDLNTYLTVTIGSSQILQFEFTYISNSLSVDFAEYGIFNEITYNKYSYLDNNFEYGIYKTEECQYFNWSKSTALYTGLRTTCQNLGIENTFTPMLMAYWLLISIIYFIFDIGLIMVHVVHRKIHEFTESV